MRIRVITNPNAEPISVIDAKTALRVYGTASDDLVSALITAGRQWAENYTGCSWAAQTLEATMDGVPASPVELYYPPLGTLDKVTVTDEDGTEHQCDTSDWIVDKEGAVLTLKTGAELPQGAQCAIRYTTTASHVPEVVKRAILVYVKGMFEDIPGQEWLPTAERMLFPYKELRV